MSILMEKAFLLSKELEECKERMNKDEDYAINKKKFDALKEILDYLISLNFITDAKSKTQLLELIHLENENSYSTSKVLNLVANHFNCSDRTIRSKVAKMDNEVRDILTPEIINLLKEERIDEALSLFRGNVTQDVDFTRIIFFDFMDAFPTPKNNEDLKLIDCISLINYATTFIKDDISKALKDFGLDKAEFLIYILTSNNPKYVNEKKLLYDVFTHKINVNELYNHLISSNEVK